MRVVSLERPLRGLLRGQRFDAVAKWDPADPYAVTLHFTNGERWTLSREAVHAALSGSRMDGPAFDAAAIEITLAEEEDRCEGAEVEVACFYKRLLQPVRVWFAERGWRQLLDDSLAIVPFGTEHAYIDWAVEFPEVMSK